MCLLDNVVSTLIRRCLKVLCANHLVEEERAGNFTLIVLLLSCVCLCLSVFCVLCLFLTVPWVGLWSVIVAFPGHTHLLYIPKSSLLTLVLYFATLFSQSFFADKTK